MINFRYRDNLALVESSQTQCIFQSNRKMTGICGPSIFSGLKKILPLPACFPVDLMHLIGLNLPDIFVKLWHGTIACGISDSKSDWTWAVLVGDVWKQHGAAVAAALPYLPGSFDRPPPNPAEKISSGYKAWEFITWIYGYCPALLHDILPLPFYQNFCKLVQGIRIIYQHSISRSDLQTAYLLLTEFCEDFETLYCQCWADRLHFAPHSIHIVSHLPHEPLHTGPSDATTQWPMERAIGDLTAQIRQPSKAYANLSLQAVQCAQVNAITSILPDLDPHHNKSHSLPHGSRDLGGGYVLLRAKDNTAREVHLCESTAIQVYLSNAGDSEADVMVTKVVRWARLRVPTGQIARSAWKETKDLTKLRMSRNVKVRFFFLPVNSLLKL